MSEFTRLLGNPIFMLFAFLIVVVVMSTMSKMARMRHVQSRGHGRLSNDESREFQELHRGFEDLAKRIEAIETILMDRGRRK